MNNFQPLLVLAFLFLSFFASDTLAAQDAILFQLPSSAGQIEAALAAGDQERADVYKRSDKQIEHAIMRSFKAEFGFCPIYFFHSSDYDKVKNKQLSQVQFYSKTGEKVSLTSDLVNYSIANISFYPKMTYQVKDGLSGETVVQEEAQNFYGKGIILYDTNYEPVVGKLRFTPCKIYRRGSILKKKNRYYDFKGAGTLNKRLQKYGIGAKSSQ